MNRSRLLRPVVPAAVASVLAAVAAPSHAADDFPTVEAHFLAPDLSSAGAAVAVGPDGSVHMTAATYNDGGDDAVLYAHCAADCARRENWRGVTMPVPRAIRAEIALTPGGAPRLLILAAAADNPGGRDFIYAECGAREAEGVPDACFGPGGWAIGRVASNHETAMGNFFELLLPQRTFAVDHRGNPRFVMTDSNYLVEPDHYGAFYMSCDGGCTDPRNWTETNLALQAGYSTESFTRPVLALGPSGSAHVLAWVFAFAPDGSDLPDDLYYYECLANCTDGRSWQRASLINAGSGSYPSPTWDLAIDPRGRPRAAVFMGGGSESDDLDYTLIYLWCDSGACTGDESWGGWVVQGEGSHGESPALAIDAAGRPRIAFLTSRALPALAACDRDCEGEAPEWSAWEFEAEPDMAADRPTAIPFTCDAELWNAMSPDLALGPDGSVHVAYDVSVQARCLYQEFMDPQITYEFHEIWRGVRLAALPPVGTPAPALPGDRAQEAASAEREEAAPQPARPRSRF